MVRYVEADSRCREEEDEADGELAFLRNVKREHLDLVSTLFRIQELTNPWHDNENHKEVRNERRDAKCFKPLICVANRRAIPQSVCIAVGIVSTDSPLRNEETHCPRDGDNHHEHDCNVKDVRSARLKDATVEKQDTESNASQADYREEVGD